MRRSIAGSVVILLLGLTAGAQISKLDLVIPGEVRVHDPRTLRSCDFGASVDEIVRKAGLILAFENTPDCPPSAAMLAPTSGGVAFENISARQALDRLMPLMPGFTWRDMNEVVVVRPIAAWGGLASPLNYPVGAFAISDGHLIEVIHTILRTVRPPLYKEHVDTHAPDALLDRPMSVTFGGGTLLDALNAMAVAHGAIEWQLGYAGRAVIAVHPLVGPAWRGGLLVPLGSLPNR